MKNIALIINKNPTRITKDFGGICYIYITINNYDMNKYVEYIITIILILILVAMHMLVICGTYVAITDFINVGYDLRVETSWWAVFSMIVLIWMDKIIFIRK